MNSLKYFSVLLNSKIRDASTTWTELIRKSLRFAHFQEYHRNREKNSEFIWFWGTLSQNC